MSMKVPFPGLSSFYFLGSYQVAENIALTMEPYMYDPMSVLSTKDPKQTLNRFA